ncbi:1-phosphofructokinase [Sansalvadorimonas verongulae]|uniref:1-phosphofructokinase n=1 Tax=Sansalvadorimonas verongulae TaxID=2172824 RepID=UPI0012BCEE12|nr:1-phosphofructokinase [Sansalvadorimonas verongulae]MTI12991.1 1-phosphofructokinase [Sansalvadorimonas verongulae]
MSRSILTVTLNPALDMTASLPELNVGKVNVVERFTLHPAGKGVNVARVLTDLGDSVAVTGFLGQENDRGFTDLFQQMNSKDNFIRVPGETRINIKLVECHGDVTDLNFPGVFISEEQFQTFETRLLEEAANHELVVIAGSLPLGVSPESFAHLISLLNKRGNKVIVDTSRDALKAAMSASPWLVKPNEEELSEWAGHALETEDALMQVGEQLSATGIAHVVISRGVNGVLWLNNGQWLKSVPPRMSVVSTVGAGDTLVAGLCHGLNQNHDRETVLRHATALSALAVSQTGVGVPDQDTLNSVIQQVSVNALNPQMM